MALKDFDYKQFLLEKGERVGLYAAGGIAVLMIGLSLFWPGKGLFSASPKKSADDIAGIAKQKQTEAQNAKPSDSEADQLRKVDAQLLKQASNVAQDPEVFRLFAEMFAPREIPSNKRQNPNIFGPQEYVYEVVPAQISNYMFIDSQGTVQVGVLKGSEKGVNKLKDINAKLRDLYGKNRGAGGAGGGMSPPGGGAGGGAGGGPPGFNPSGRQEGSKGFGTGGGGGGDDKSKELQWVRKEELAGQTGAEYARDLLPRQMAIVAGSFPYRAQVEEFQKALRLDTSYNVVFKETVTEKDKGTAKPAFRFVGFDVQRKTYGPETPNGGEWEPLDFTSSKSEYRHIAAQVLNEFTPENPDVKQLLVPNLFLPRPVQVPLKPAGAKPDTSKSSAELSKPYPNVELQLPKIEATLKKLTPAQKTLVQQSKFDENAFTPFTGDEKEETKPAEAAPTSNEWKPPDFCVLRFLDVTIQPGRTYEYEVRVKMANPNFGKTDDEVANIQLTKDKELKSEWYPVKGPDGQVLRIKVNDDLYYYAVDEQALKAAPTKDPRAYKGMNAGPNNVTGYDPTRQAVVQVHRWKEFYELTRGRKTYTYPVGDWVVGERMFVHRGEYVGSKPAHTHIPIWSPEQNSFVLAGRPPARGQDRRPVEELTFIDRNRAPLLVDFEGVTATYHRPAAPAPTYPDGTPVEGGKPMPPTDIKAAGVPSELLLLTPDGKLVAHDSVTDENDRDRKERVAKYEDRIAEAEGKVVEHTPTKPGANDPFKPK